MKKTVEIDVPVDATDVLEAIDSLGPLDLARVASYAASVLLRHPRESLVALQGFTQGWDGCSILRRCADAIEWKDGMGK
jgi:hypothetical protein